MDLFIASSTSSSSLCQVWAEVIIQRSSRFAVVGQQRPEKNSRRGYSPDAGILTIKKTQALICYGATWSWLSCKPLKKLLGLFQKKARTGLTKMITKSRNCPNIRHTLHNHPVHIKRWLSTYHAATSNAGLEISKMNDGWTLQKKSTTCSHW